MEKIFKWLTEESHNEKSSVYSHWFATNFSHKDFVGVDRLLFCYVSYCSQLFVTPSLKYLHSYLKVDGKRDIKKYNIKEDTMTAYDYSQNSQLEEAFSILSKLATTTYNKYIAVDLEDRNFSMDMREFMNDRKAEVIQDAFMNYYPKLSDGSDVTEVSSNFRQHLADIDKTWDPKKIATMSDATSSDDEEDMEYICDWSLPCLDNATGGIYTKCIYTLNAQPGGGKTRMAEIHGIYQALTVAKVDVLMYELELTKKQVKNILIAYHIMQVYGGRFKIPDSLLNKPHLLSPEQRQIYESAKIDLFESGKYGNLIIKTDLYVETYEEELETELRNNPNLRLLVVDYMGLMESKPANKFDKQLTGYEIIREGYIITRRVLKRHRLGAICINQFNDKGIEAAYAGKQIRPGHIEGGQIVMRHTDCNIDLTFTEEQELAGVRMLAISKARGNAKFRNVQLNTELSVSIFEQAVDI